MTIIKNQKSFCHTIATRNYVEQTFMSLQMKKYAFTRTTIHSSMKSTRLLPSAFLSIHLRTIYYEWWNAESTPICYAQNMGVGRIFTGGGNSGCFKWSPKRFFQAAPKIWLTRNKTSFFAKNLIGKYQITNSRGSQDSPCPPSAAHGSDYPRIVQKNKHVTKNNANIKLVHSSKNYYRLVNKNNRMRFLFTRIINIMTHKSERSSRFLYILLQKKKNAGE